MQHATTSITRKHIASLLVSLAVVIAMAVPATAQPVITGGLVNVTVTDIETGDILSENELNLAVALALAANVCDVNVNVLARQLRSGGAECEVGDQRITITQRS